MDDMFSKVLTGKRLRWLVKPTFFLGRPNVDGSARAMVARHSPMKRATFGKCFVHVAGCEFAKKGLRDFGELVLHVGSCRMLMDCTMVIRSEPNLR